MRLIGIICLLALAGCQAGHITTAAGTRLTPPKDASGPSVVTTGTRRVETTFPAGTVIVMEKAESSANKPATETISITPPLPITQTIVEATEAVSVAAPRAPDKSVELKKADDAARAPLLWLAIGLGVAGLAIAVVLKHPALGGMVACLGGGGAFAAWKLADVPSWLWGAGLLVAGLCYAFYRRGHWDANGNGIPDALENS